MSTPLNCGEFSGACQGCGGPLAPNKAPGTPRKWCSERCRKRQYDRACIDCGARVDGSTPSRCGGRCVRCAGEARRIWTPEAVITAIQAWAREHGGIPPAATDWNPNQAIAVGRPEKAEKFYADDAWPYVSTVQAAFGSWLAGIRAAGLTPRPVGCYGREGEGMDLCREIADRYAQGETSADLAGVYDCTPETIRYRVRKAGGVMRPKGKVAA